MSDSRFAERVRRCCECGKDIVVRSNHPAAKCLDCKNPLRVCLHCGKNFRPTSNSGGKFCSNRCWQTYRPEETRRQWAALCNYCGSKFALDRHARLRRRKDPAAKVYCDSLCANNAKAAVMPLGSRRVPTKTGQNYGYVEFKAGKDYPGADRSGWIKEHRYVMQEHLGRPLEPFENVHHINGVRGDNRLENLELWTKPQPIGQRPEDLADWVVEHYPHLVAEAMQKRQQRLTI